MSKGHRYKWVFTFMGKDESVLEITLPEDHKEIKYLKNSSQCYLGIATLVDTSKYNPLLPYLDLEGIVHSVVLPPSKLESVFKRVEQDVLHGTSRVIPSFSFARIDTKEIVYCFAFIDKVVMTDDRRYHRREREMALYNE
jgi:hypothetical protein